MDKEVLFQNCKPNPVKNRMTMSYKSSEQIKLRKRPVRERNDAKFPWKAGILFYCMNLRLKDSSTVCFHENVLQGSTLHAWQLFCWLEFDLESRKPTHIHPPGVGTVRAELYLGFHSFHVVQLLAVSYISLYIYFYFSVNATVHGFPVLNSGSPAMRRTGISLKSQLHDSLSFVLHDIYSYSIRTHWVM